MATQTYTDGVTLTSAAEFNRFDTVSYSVLTGVAGTNTVTATGPANYTYSATTPPVWIVPASTNTGATTINITPSGGSALGAKNVFSNGAACIGGELRSGVPTAIIYDGTQFNIIASGLGILLGTAQATTSGTEKDFTVTGAKRITIMLIGVSFDGVAKLRVQLGDAGGIENSGYIGAASTCIATASSEAGTAGIDLPELAAAAVLSGKIVLDLQDSADFRWSASIALGRSDSADAIVGGYYKALSAAITTVRVTTVAGTAAFDAGEINVSTEK